MNRVLACLLFPLTFFLSFLGHAESVCVKDNLASVDELKGAVHYTVLDDEVRVDVLYQKLQGKAEVSKLDLYFEVASKAVDADQLDDINYLLRVPIEFVVRDGAISSRFFISRKFRRLVLVLSTSRSDVAIRYCDSRYVFNFSRKDISKPKLYGEIRPEGRVSYGE